MAEMPRMDESQLREARKLIRKRCCNYDCGNCLALDDGIDPQCAQWNSYGLQCIWFRQAVLPNDRGLEAAILNICPTKRCVICAKPIFSKSNRAKYCPSCGKNVRRQKEAIRLHNHYLKSRI